MIRIVAVLLAFAASAASHAVAPVDPTAIVGKGEVLRGLFDQQRILAGLEKPVLSHGRFVLAPGRGLIWQVEAPFEIVTVITPDGLQQKVTGGATTRIPADRLPFLRRLFELLGGSLAGDWAMLQRQFRVTRSGDAAGWTARLEPRSSEGLGMPFTSIRLKGSRFVEQVELLKSNGDRDLLTFRGQTLTPGPPKPDEAAAFAELSH